MQLTIQRRLLLLTLGSLLFITIVGGVGYWSAAKLGSAKDEIQINQTAIRDQMQADMMHDALRGDVMGALLAAIKNDTAAAASARTDYEEHSGSFNESITELEGLGLSEGVRKALGCVRPAMADYTNRAGEMLDLAARDTKAADAALQDFLVSFKKLESEMEELGDAIEADSSDVQAAASTETTKLVLLITAALAWLVLLAWSTSITRSITRPLKSAVDIAGAVARGRLDQDIKSEARDETGQLLRSLADMTTSLGEIVLRVRSGTASMAQSAAQVADGTEDLAQRTSNQSTALEGATARMEFLAGTVRENAARTEEARGLSVAAANVAHGGEEAVGHVIETMTAIATSSRRIEEIISVIEGIAFQTNILALNAAVEAARADEQGRGFAVVSSEVRSLAQRSAEAAREIKKLIEESATLVRAGSGQVQIAGSTMQDVVASIRKVTTLMDSIAASTGEQNVGIAKLASAMREMDTVTQQNAALVEESSAATQAMRTEARELTLSVGRFQLRESLASSSGYLPTTKPRSAAAHHAEADAASRSAEPCLAGSGSDRS